MIGILGGIFYITNSKSSVSYKMLAIGVAISMIIDIGWFYCYSSHWSTGDGPDGGIKRFSFGMSILGFIVKIVATGYFGGME